MVKTISKIMKYIRRYINYTLCPTPLDSLQINFMVADELFSFEIENQC